MNRLTQFLLALVVTVLLATAAMAEGYTAGKQYQVLTNPQPTSSGDKIEVVEMFWYGCPHCYRLEPFIEEWQASKAEDVEFVQMPAIIGPPWELLAKAFYTAEFLGVTDKLHPALFDAIHKDHKKLNNEDAVQAVFVEQGVSEEDFKKTFNSFAVSVKINNARLMTKRYAITGVPTIIVNGKYSTSGSLAGSNENLIKVVNYLIDQERQAAAPEAAATASE
ncbi:MAG: thiol:disulfide interchange protein DsbA/DsbL [Gammaproteobacteria bacterium]|jgi:thiol:disulfide interchange protein DsbA|nr:thiol:disulfide interchange protein DsbA/DsbL [Gammaproteobacteria bacterium]